VHLTSQHCLREVQKYLLDGVASFRAGVLRGPAIFG
jgi:hypothetical protein